MGCCIHVIKRQRDYGNTEAFNYRGDEFKLLLESIGAEVYTQDDCNNFFEMELNDFDMALYILKEIEKSGQVDMEKFEKKFGCTNGNDKFKENFNLETTLEAIKELGEDVTYIVKVLKSFRRERDKKSNWIQFEMW